MGFLSKLFNRPQKDEPASGLPVNWKQTLRTCNFFMARRVVADFFRRANQQAEAEGNQSIWKKEIADGWEQFFLNPCYETAVRFVTVSPPILPYFDSSVLQSLYLPIWTATTFSFEGYRLPSKTSDIRELRELSPQEYAFFPRQFKGEVIYHASPIHFIGQKKWKFMVSSVNGRIYKWAASLEVGRDEDFDSIGNEVIEYCVRWLGATTEEKLGYLFWDTSDGNVILQLANMDDWFDISIFVTSREISGLEKL
jgi:hypothetical protein